MKQPDFPSEFQQRIGVLGAQFVRPGEKLEMLYASRRTLRMKQSMHMYVS